MHSKLKVFDKVLTQQLIAVITFVSLIDKWP